MRRPFPSWRGQSRDLVWVRSSWRSDRREDLERIVRHELPSVADAVLPAHDGLEVDHGFARYWRSV